MKKHLLLASAFLFGFSVANSQEEIDIQSIDAATGGSQTLIVDSVKENTSALLLMGVFNSFSNGSDVDPGDTLTFSWKVDGAAQTENVVEVSTTIMNLQNAYIVFQPTFSVGAEGTRTICATNTYNSVYGDVSGIASEVCDDILVYKEDTGGSGGNSIRLIESELTAANAFFSHEKLFISMESTQGEMLVDVQVMDLTGQIVLNEEMNVSGGGIQHWFFDFGSQAEGVYLVNLTTKGIQKSIKFVKY